MPVKKKYLEHSKNTGTTLDDVSGGPSSAEEGRNQRYCRWSIGYIFCNKKDVVSPSRRFTPKTAKLTFQEVYEEMAAVAETDLLFHDDAQEDSDIESNSDGEGEGEEVVPEAEQLAPDEEDVDEDRAREGE